MTVTTWPNTAYTCQCPDAHPLAPDDAPEADVYLRISQDRTGQAYGVERQMWDCCRLAGMLGYRVGRVWTDNDISATSGAYRPAFESLLKAEPKVIITWHTDRFVRLTKELERIIALNVNVHAVTAGHFDLSNPAGRATAKTLTAWAQYEGEQKALRQKAAAVQRARQGRPNWTIRPFGFNRDGSHVPIEAARVRRLYNDFLLGKSLSEMCRELNDEGHRTGTGNPWRTPALRLLLAAHRNAGIRTYSTGRGKNRVVEEIGPGAWEAIVPEEIFRATVHKLADPGRRTNPYGGRLPRNLLTQIAICGICGNTVKASTVVRTRKSGKRTSDPYYRCTSSEGRRHIAFPVEWTDGVVLNEVTRLLQDPEFHEAWQTGPVTDPAEVEALRVEEAACRERIDEADEDRADGLLSRAAHLKITERNNKRLAEIEQALAQIGSQSQLATMLADLELVWQDMDDMSLVERRRLVATIFDRIELHPRVLGTQRGHVRADIHMVPRKGPDGSDTH